MSLVSSTDRTSEEVRVFCLSRGGMASEMLVNPRYGDGYGTVSPSGSRYISPRRMHPQSGAVEKQEPRLPPLSPRGDRLSLNMSPRWSAPSLTPRLHPDEVAKNVRESSYIRAKQVVPPEYLEIVKPAPPPAKFRPTPREIAQKRAAEQAKRDAEAAAIAAEAAAIAAAEAARVQAEADAEAARQAALAAAQTEYSYSDTEEEEDGDGDEMDDDFDEQMLMMARQRGGRGGAGGDRRMSLADMKGADMKKGLGKLRESLSALEVDEYRDFFDLVDEDNGGTLDAQELQQAMKMMGMEAPDEQIKAMIGEAKEGDDNSLEMDFEEFLTLMAIFVGPRGDQQEKELEEAFNTIDDDGGGTIDMDELAEAFRKYGEKVSQEELDGIVKIVDADGDGEIDLEEFKTIMMTAVAADAPDTERTLRRKMRSTVRALIMQHRMAAAFGAMNARYDFLRFQDAKIIAPENQTIHRLHQSATTMEAANAMRTAGEIFAPVYEDEECKESPIGFVSMMDIVHVMLDSVKLAFKLPTNDTMAVQMRLERITDSAGQFAQTTCKNICDNKWNAIRPGYSVNDVGMVLEKGATRVPYIGEDGNLAYIISQQSFVSAFNEDPRVRLGGVGHVTAMDLGGLKSLPSVTEKDQLMSAFELLAEDPPSGAVVVVDSETGEIKWYISADTLKLAGKSGPELATCLSKPIEDLYDVVVKSPAFKKPATITPETPMLDMVRLIVETSSHRLWVVDGQERPIGVVSLTNMIQCIMKTDK
jgi:Ca2+-binding EF-hand superfamily protein/CBS-domain-containing membrane protein